MTPAAQRSVPTPVSLGTPTLVVTITLTDPPVADIAAAAEAGGLSAAERSALAVAQLLRIATAQTQIIQTLTQEPYNALLIDQSMSADNIVTVQIKADRVREIEALPGVLAVRVGTGEVPPVEETPSRGDFQPGTRVPPPRPPGFNN